MAKRSWSQWMGRGLAMFLFACLFPIAATADETDFDEIMRALDEAVGLLETAARASPSWDAENAAAEEPDTVEHEIQTALDTGIALARTIRDHIASCRRRAAELDLIRLRAQWDGLRRIGADLNTALATDPPAATRERLLSLWRLARDYRRELGQTLADLPALPAPCQPRPTDNGTQAHPAADMPVPDFVDELVQHLFDGANLDAALRATREAAPRTDWMVEPPALSAHPDPRITEALDLFDRAEARVQAARRSGDDAAYALGSAEIEAAQWLLSQLVEDILRRAYAPDIPTTSQTAAFEQLGQARRALEGILARTRLLPRLGDRPPSLSFDVIREVTLHSEGSYGEGLTCREDGRYAANLIVFDTANGEWIARGVHEIDIDFTCSNYPGTTVNQGGENIAATATEDEGVLIVMLPAGLTASTATWSVDGEDVTRPFGHWVAPEWRQIRIPLAQGSQIGPIQERTSIRHEDLPPHPFGGTLYSQIETTIIP